MLSKTIIIKFSLLVMLGFVPLLSNADKGDIDSLVKSVTDISNNAKQIVHKGRYKNEIDEISKKTKSMVSETVHDYQGKQSSTQKRGSLYYFVSFSMPEKLIKSYIIDSIYTGGTIVIRGVEKDKSLKAFIFERILPLVQYKGKHVAIEIDPNLFETYQIDSVPSIVYTTLERWKGCEATKSNGFALCKDEPSDNYWRITGSVSTRYALQQFSAAGAGSDFLLERAMNKKLASGKIQPAFEGEWKDIGAEENKSLSQFAMRNKLIINFDGSVQPLKVGSAL